MQTKVRGNRLILTFGERTQAAKVRAVRSSEKILRQIQYLYKKFPSYYKFHLVFKYGYSESYKQKIANEFMEDIPGYFYRSEIVDKADEIYPPSALRERVAVEIETADQDSFKNPENYEDLKDLRLRQVDIIIFYARVKPLDMDAYETNQ